MMPVHAQHMLFQALGGLGLFMLGMHFLSDGIRALAASHMRSIMEKLAKNRLMALLTSAFVTAVVQSSTLVTVMIVGFVNSAIINLEQAIALIMGANIGTTVTTVLIALPIAKYGLPLAGIAALVFISVRKEKIRNAALTALGLGMIFFGLDLIISGFRPLRTMPEVISFIAALDASSIVGILKCVLVGAILTAIIHSSAAMNGIVMGMAASGVLGWQTSMAIVLGAEIGTTVTSLLAAATLSSNARRTSYAHVAFNVIGAGIAVLAFPLVTQWSAFLVGGDPGQARVLEGVTTYPLAPLSIAAFVTSFNILSTVLLLPFVPLGAKLLNRIGKGAGEEAEDLAVPRFLFRKALDAPQAAITLLEKEQTRFREALPRILDGICRPERSVSPQKLRQSLEALHREIADFGERLCGKELTVELASSILQLLHRQEMTSSLMLRLVSLVDFWGKQGAGTPSRQMAGAWIEALDALIHESLEALSASDPQHLVTLQEMTRHHGPRLEAMRRRYLEDGEKYNPIERQYLLTVLGELEGCLWLLDRLGRGGGMTSGSKPFQVGT